MKLIEFGKIEGKKPGRGKKNDHKMEGPKLGLQLIYPATNSP